MKKFSDLSREWQKDPAYLDALEEVAPEFEIARALVAARKLAGLTQAQVAERMGATQSQVARMESGKNVRSDTLVKYAQATGHKVALVAA